MKSQFKRYLLALAVLVMAQTVLWVVHGRHRLRGEVALFDVELSARIAQDRGKLRGRQYGYLMLSEEVANSLSSSDLERYKKVLSSYAPAKVLTYNEWSQLCNSVGPEERWDLVTTETDCVNVTPRMNTPFVAKVACDDACLDMAWHGHEHWFVFVLGKWIHVHRSGDWVA